MTNEERDKICCEFAGMEPAISRWWIKDSGSIMDFRPTEAYAKAAVVDNRLQNPSIEHELEYPPVSSSWEAAGRLMDALRSKIWFNLNAAPDYYKAEVAMDGCDPIIHRNKSGPMALALAVAAVAKEPQCICKWRQSTSAYGMGGGQVKHVDPNCPVHKESH